MECPSAVDVRNSTIVVYRLRVEIATIQNPLLGVQTVTTRASVADSAM